MSASSFTGKLSIIKRDGEIKPGCEVVMHGIDFGTVNGESAVVFHQLKGKYLILKYRGHSYWSGRGRPFSYAPTSFVVCKLVHSEPAIDNERYAAYSTQGVVEFEAKA